MALGSLIGAGIGALGGIGQLIGGSSVRARARKLQEQGDKQAEEATRRMERTGDTALARSSQTRFAPENIGLYASESDAINRGLSQGMAAARQQAAGSGSGNLARNLLSAGLDASRARGQAESGRVGRQIAQRDMANQMESQALQLRERAPRFQGERLDRQAQAAAEAGNALTGAGIQSLTGVAGGLMNADAYASAAGMEGPLDGLFKGRGGSAAPTPAALDTYLLDRLGDYGSAAARDYSSRVTRRAEGGRVPGEGAGDRVEGMTTEGDPVMVEPDEAIVSKADEQYILEPIGGEAPLSPRDVDPESAAEIGYRLLDVFSKYSREAVASDVRNEALAIEEETGVPPAAEEIRRAIGGRFKA